MQKNSREEQEASIAVSNTSPLIALKHTGLLERISQLFQRIVVPPSVMRELGVKEKKYFQSLVFLSVEEPRDERLVAVLETVVDGSEAEAIALALEKGSLLVIDDLKGRKLARRLGLRIIGTLGLLKTLKLKGLIREVKPAIERLKEKGFYINNNLVDSLLRDLGEK
ncbi:MAG: DUF3368 domain-containing protein [Desulfurococcales archaeon]|nr:DUF3368 domain-containing protein [Desulfurococcales archaeon]